jgi:hypothetical protein
MGTSRDSGRRRRVIGRSWCAQSAHLTTDKRRAMGTIVHGHGGRSLPPVSRTRVGVVGPKHDSPLSIPGVDPSPRSSFRPRRAV